MDGFIVKEGMGVGGNIFAKGSDGGDSSENFWKGKEG